MKEIHNEIQNIADSVLNIGAIIEEDNRITDIRLSKLEVTKIRLAEMFEDMAKILRKADEI